MKKRKSNIELLRIVLILMIIVLHYFNGNMGGVLKHVEEGTINYYLAHLLESLCIVAVNAFVLITGYFSYKKEVAKVSKVVNLLIVMVFWGMVLSTLTVLVIATQNIDSEVVKSVINQSSYKTLLIIGLIFFYIWPSFYTKVTLNDGGYGIVNFIYLYFIGAYIRKYQESDKKIVISLFIYIISAFIVFGFSFKFARAWDYCFVFNLIGSVALFEAFRSLNLKHSKIINKLATYTFAVYLIDVNEFFNHFLYRTLFHSNRYWNNDGMITNLIISVIGIYTICVILEWLRRLFFADLFNWLVEKVKFEIKA